MPPRKYFTDAAAKAAHLAQTRASQRRAAHRTFDEQFGPAAPQPAPSTPIKQVFLSIPAPLPGSIAMSFHGWVWR